MNQLKVSDFYYDLPRRFIAQEPAARREDSRLMVYSRRSGNVEHRRFADIGEYLPGGSLIVLNDTKVIPARLTGRKDGTGGKVEVFLLGKLEPNLWECLIKPWRRLRKGATVVFGGSAMRAALVGRCTRDTHSVMLGGVDDIAAEIDRVGHIPLPPYIKRSRGDTLCTDRERYQTVYAVKPGAVAAPTAGLHFSRRLLRELAERGVESACITLHVGLGTFQPVREKYVPDHRLRAEYFEIGEEAAEKINRARRAGRRVLIVGTTTTRALESVAAEDGLVQARRGWTDLFIYPPYRFRLVENLLTNFHLPSSTLLMLVAAMVGRETLLDLYEEAKREGYRFYSYGDAMLIMNGE